MESEVSLLELKAVAVSLLDSLIHSNGKDTVNIDPNTDFYWEVPPESLYSVKTGQPKLDVGRLADDWEFIRPIADDPQAATPLALIHLAPILRYLAGRVRQKP